MNTDKQTWTFASYFARQCGLLCTSLTSLLMPQPTAWNPLEDRSAFPPPHSVPMKCLTQEGRYLGVWWIVSKRITVVLLPVPMPLGSVTCKSPPQEVKPFSSLETWAGQVTCFDPWSVAEVAAFQGPCTPFPSFLQLCPSPTCPSLGQPSGGRVAT